MFFFNLLPIFPLDGYRIINDLFLTNYGLLKDEVISYIGLILSFLAIIYFYIFHIFGFTIIFAMLFLINYFKLKQIKKQKKVFYNLIEYKLAKLANNKNI